MAAIGNPDEERLDEHAPLLGYERAGDDRTPARKGHEKTARRLYLSHFLSTWNSRVFEFGAVIYLATIFPDTLMPMSVYAFILFQRIAVAISCAAFYVLVLGLPLGRAGEAGVLVILSLFACVEKICSIMNMVAVEKDWVVVVADGDQDGMMRMNSQMRRIDLFCKLLGPLFIAMIEGVSVQLALIVNLAMNIASVVAEYYAIARVYNDVPALQEPKQASGEESTIAESSGDSQTRLGSLLGYLRRMAKQSFADFRLYFRHRAFLPSIAGAFLYLTVLNFAGQMITYLLYTGFTATIISLARTLGVAFEVLATWVAPWLMGRIGPVRAGLWMSIAQVTMLVAGFAVFWVSEAERPLLSTAGLVGGTILSRLGLRGFDMCTQIIVQEDVEPESRGVFSTVEAAWQNAFELLSYIATIIFFRPEQFKWPSLISVAAVASASATYTVFVYIRRGHLLHLDALAGLLGSRRAKQKQRERALGRIMARSDL
ncbi:Solute carrier family 40 member 1 like protein [Verticillium longisporum]|nr:Solute carrier family 40 member 1 like protein [Verticillium longisporum]